MSKQLLNELVEESQTRYTALTREWKPYRRVIWFVSIIASGITWAEKAGDFTFPLLGLVALTSFLSLSPRFAPPIVGFQLLGRRALALMTDFILVSVVSFSSLVFLQSENYF